MKNQDKFVINLQAKTLDGKNFPVQTNNNETCEELGKKIINEILNNGKDKWSEYEFAHEENYYKNFRFIFGGKELDPKLKVQDYNLDDDFVIHTMFKVARAIPRRIICVAKNGIFTFDILGTDIMEGNLTHDYMRCFEKIFQIKAKEIYVKPKVNTDAFTAFGPAKRLNSEEIAPFRNIYICFDGNIELEKLKQLSPKVLTEDLKLISIESIDLNLMLNPVKNICKTNNLSLIITGGVFGSIISLSSSYFIKHYAEVMKMNMLSSAYQITITGCFIGVITTASCIFLNYCHRSLFTKDASVEVGK